MLSAETFMATWPSGKARVCKTLITGSNPVVASNYEFQIMCVTFLATFPQSALWCDTFRAFCLIGNLGVN